jgi:hypothetical protein
MRSPWKLRQLGLALWFLVGAAWADPTTAPAASPPADATVAFSGRVVYQSIEGGFWGIVADDGSRYLPEALPAALQHDGLRVHVRAVPSAQGFGVQMWGMRVRVVDIDVESGAP